MPRWLFMSFAVILLATYQWLVGLIFTQWNIPSGFWPELWLTNSEGGFPALEFPILGWITIMAFGYILGRQMSSPVFSRPYFWSGLGGCLLGGWLILRWAGSFGDLNPYVDGDHWYYFFNMSKSPPSLTYQAFYIGLAMFFMAILFAYGDWLKTQPGRWLVTVGQVPLFFFVIHPAVFRPLAYLITSMNTSLPVTFQAWVVWLLGLSLLIPLSFGYRRLRQNNPGSILRYL
jgi:hypothetical protein